MKEKVKPCKCGKQPYLSTEYKDGNHYYSIVCINCCIKSDRSFFKKNAIKNWNEEIYRD